MSSSEDKSVSDEAKATPVPAKKNKRKRKRGQKNNQELASETPSPEKKAKINSPKTPAIAPKDSSDENSPEEASGASEGASRKPEGAILDLGRNCFARVNKFNGKTYLDFRMYYKPKDSNKMMPGNKGVSFTTDQWKILKKNLHKLDAALKNACE